MSLEATLLQAEAQLRADASAEALLDVIETAAKAGSSGLPLLVAQLDGACPTPLAQALSFVLAAVDGVARESSILVGSWLVLSERVQSDEVTNINLLNWVARTSATPPLRTTNLFWRALSDLFLACAASSSIPVHLRLLDTLVGVPELAQMALNREAGEAIRRGLMSLSKHTDELTLSDLAQLELTVQSLAAKPTSEAARNIAVDEMFEPIRRHAGAQNLDKRFTRKLTSWLAEQRVLASSIDHVAKTRSPLFEFKFLHDLPSLKSVGDLSAAFDMLLSSLSQTLGAPFHLQPLAASRGSFSMRAELGGSEAATQALTDLMSLLAATQSQEAMAQALRERYEVARRLKTWLDVVARQPQIVRTTVIRPGTADWRHVVRVTPDEASSGGAFLQLETVHPGEQIHKRGSLIAADLNRRTFTARIAGDDIEGEASAELLDRATVGDTYDFAIRLTTFEKLTGHSEKWILVDLERPIEGETDDAEHGRAQRALRTADVPQATLAKIYTLMDVLGAGQEPTPAALQVKHRRNVDYYLAGARILGLVDRDQQVSAFGRMWLLMGPDARARRLAFKFEESKVAQAWVYWAAALRLSDVDPDSASSFLSETTSLREGTLPTRAGCLRKWLKALRPYLES